MPRPIVVADEDLLRGLLTRHLPLGEDAFPEDLQPSVPWELILRDLPGPPGEPGSGLRGEVEERREPTE